MIDYLKKSKTFTPCGVEYKFCLYSFDAPSDFLSSDIIKGQSLVFISNRVVDDEDKATHSILYAATTNNLAYMSQNCDWTTLQTNNANCLGVLRLDKDINETIVIEELAKDRHFSEVQFNDATAEEIHFLQGNEDYFDKNGIKAANLNAVKDKIREFFNMKNVSFLFGSGTSSPAIPIMTGLMKAIRKSELSEDEKEMFETIANVKEDNIEEILGTLYSEKVYLEGMGDDESDDYELCNGLINKIEEVIYDKLTPCLNVKGMTATTRDVLDSYKRLYSKVTNRNKDLARINVFTTNNDLFNETALDSLNIHYVNGFSGGLKKYFNPAFFNYTFSKRMDTSLEKFEPVNNMVYLYKIHGSVNWVEDDTDNNSYFNIRELSELPEDYDGAAMIYPTPLKQNKSLGSPYVDLFREFQHKLLEANSVLFVIGYSFNDEHINDIIYRSLVTNTSLILVIINNLDEKQPICKVNDNRVFRFWGHNADRSVKYHYFDYFTDNLVHDFELETRSQKDQVEQLVKVINDSKKNQ